MDRCCDAAGDVTSAGANQCLYDGDGNRVAKTVTNLATHLSSTTQYLVEDDVNPTGYPQVVEELTGPIGSGMVTRSYTYGLQRISENQIVQGTWTPSFYGYDGGGSVRQLTNTVGVVTDEYEYDAFGNSFTRSGTTPNNYLYRGEQYDSDLALYYLRARYYNPNTGRFLSRDPLAGNAKDPASLHKYLYAGGDPINYIDPRGSSPLVEGGSLQSNFELAVNASLRVLGQVVKKCFVNIAVSIAAILAYEEFPSKLSGGLAFWSIVEDGLCLLHIIPGPPPYPPLDPCRLDCVINQ
jgi:RHS repeat-associated protein